MKLMYLKHIFVVSAVGIVSIAAYCRTESQPTVVFDLGEAGSRYYRIPAVAMTADSILVALADKRGKDVRDLPNIISVVAKRSMDGGKTWGEMTTIAQGDSATGKTYGDPAVIFDKTTGALVTVFSGDNGYFYSNAEKRAGFYVSRSYDGGKTWEEPRPITDMIYQPGWEGSFCASGSLTRTSDGRLLFAAATRLSPEWEFKDIYVFVCSSSDGGETWKVLNPEERVPEDGKGNESKIVELGDGRLILSMRNPGFRRFSYSEDGGRSWSKEIEKRDLIEPDCNGDILRVEIEEGKALLLQSLPADAEYRRDVTVYVSEDDGETWNGTYKITNEESGYSSLVNMGNGRIGCLYEEEGTSGIDPSIKGYRIVFKTFNIN